MTGNFSLIWNHYLICNKEIIGGVNHVGINFWPSSFCFGLFWMLFCSWYTVKGYSTVKVQELPQIALLMDTLMNPSWSWQTASVQAVENTFPTKKLCSVYTVLKITFPSPHVLDSKLLQLALFCHSRLFSSPIKFILAMSFNCLNEFLIFWYSGYCHAIPVFLLEAFTLKWNELTFRLQLEEISECLKAWAQ